MKRCVVGRIRDQADQKSTEPNFLVDDLRVFRATEGSTEKIPLFFGAETVLWPTAAKKGGKWYRGVVEAAECFMTRWHRDEVESGWLRHATEDAKSDDKGREGRPY